MQNTNPETGVRFGVIAISSLDPDVAELLMYGPDAVDETYEAAYKEEEASANAEVEALLAEAGIAATETDALMSDYDREGFIERWLEKEYADLGVIDSDDIVAQRLEAFSDMFQCDEPDIRGTYDDIEYRVGWLGGAPLLWVLKGPHGMARSLCSPCIPNAADLDSGFCRETEVSGLQDEGYFCYVVPSNWLPAQEAQAA